MASTRRSVSFGTGLPGGSKTFYELDATVVHPPDYILPRIPLLAVYGAAYLPCMPVLAAAVSDAPRDGLLDLGVPDDVIEAMERYAESKDIELCGALDVAVILHASPIRQECQKFVCSSTAEINMMYHLWAPAEPIAAITPEILFTIPLAMGVFHPHLVLPAHLDLLDAGIAFGALEERSVVIHDTCFSPENAMLALDDAAAAPEIGDDIAWFWSAAVSSSGRAVAVRHFASTTAAATPRPLVELVREAVDGAPQTARGLAGWLLLSYLISLLSGGATWLALIPGRTIPPHLYVWNLVTAPWIEHSLVGAIVDATAMLVMGGVAEKLWGRTEFIRFVVIIPSLANVSMLFALLGGFTAGTGALAVVLKQILPERPIPIFASFLPPSSSGPAFALILDAAFFSHSMLTLVEGAAGVVVAWTYLRFYQKHDNGVRGDFSDSFAFASFFPDAMQPALSAVGAILFRALVACSVCTPRASMVDSTGEYQAATDPAGSLFHLAPHAHGSAPSLPGHATANGTSSHISPPLVPAATDPGASSDVVTAERRRQTALKILEGRLERMAAAEQS
ncbi:uncharacterized protein AMSG_00848 [Thecamonas trahens ATCC 50062]|uniref:Transmembrane protein n=1 Tax=Thecamonas trahens ATCC 50062 TaxID=461836 RepID=A0A0L0DEP3_THETB|nr:transmembrane protein [Thecamonas trahens ATCC 50062]KNC50690.1 transmembrane protein [Thecamonas trahens ATCC 50062]|eukprot:XP_013762567.1 transmembrane protein [Thecamonas trahens ATCC 50062]